MERVKRLGDPEAAVLSYILRELDRANVQSALVGMAVDYQGVHSWRLGQPEPRSFLERFSGQKPSVRVGLPEDWNRCSSDGTSCGKVIFLGWRTLDAGVVEVDVLWGLGAGGEKLHRYSVTRVRGDRWAVAEAPLPPPPPAPARLAMPPNSALQLSSGPAAARRQCAKGPLAS